MQILRASEVTIRALAGSEAPEARATYDGDAIRIVVTTMPPRTQNEHLHERLLEVTYVLEGRVEVAERLGHDDLEWIDLGPDDCAIFPPGRFHNLRNVSGSQARTLTVKVAVSPELDAAAFREILSEDWLPRDPARR